MFFIRKIIMNVVLSEKSRVSQKKQPKSCFIINIYLTLRPKGSNV